MASSDFDAEDETIYKVVVNHEEQYSIWPVHRDNPPGWRDAGKTGRKSECLNYVDEVWTDMRPLSLRQQMAASERPPARSAPSPMSTLEATPVDLVKFLCEGDHPLEASLRPEPSAGAFKERIDMGFVHVRFTDTRGGTELGVKIDGDTLDVSRADFGNVSGTVHLEGELKLDYVKVRCVADIDLETLTGRGHLRRVDS